MLCRAPQMIQGRLALLIAFRCVGARSAKESPRARCAFGDSPPDDIRVIFRCRSGCRIVACSSRYGDLAHAPSERWTPVLRDGCSRRARAERATSSGPGGIESGHFRSDQPKVDQLWSRNSKITSEPVISLRTASNLPPLTRFFSTPSGCWTPRNQSGNAIPFSGATM